MKFLTSLAAYVPPSGGAAPPGTENISTVVQWILWGVSVVLFVYFITALAQAAKSRRSGQQADAEAPVIVLIVAIVLGAAGTIWAVIA